MPGMRAFLAVLLASALSLFQAPLHAQERYYNQAELDALLAPIALYPDPLLSQVLMAATYPDDVHEAAAWSRANPQLKGEDAVRAAQSAPWDPSVKSLLAFPEVLARMDESPQWLADLGQAFLVQQPHVMETVQGLRRRAQASGYLPEQNLVQQEGSYLAIYPAQPYVYVPYYDPLVVYGPWWWAGYRPVYWRPWRPAPVFVSTTFFFGTVDWPRRYVTVVRRPVYVHANQRYVASGRWRHIEHRPAPIARPYVRVPEANRQPIVRSAPTGVRPMPPALRAQSDFKRHQERRDAPPMRARSNERPGRIAVPVPQAIPRQLGFERRELRHDPRSGPGNLQRGREGKHWGHGRG